MAKADADEAFEEARDVIGKELATREESFDLGLGEKIRSDGLARVDSGVEAYRQIIDQILNAESIEDILSDQEAGSVKDYAGQYAELKDFKFIDSDFEGGANYYAGITMQLKGDEHDTFVTTGQQRIIAQLVALHAKKAFPITVKITQSKRPNRYGSYMYWFTEGK